MEQITKTIDGTVYRFICETRNTRNGFKHTAMLFEGDNHFYYEKATCHYLNRTWESWRYQSACRECVYKVIENLKVNAIKRYKLLTGTKRLTQDAKEIIWNENEDIIKYRKLRDSLD